MVVLACNPTFGNLETEKAGIQCQAQLLSSFEASLVYVRLFKKKQNKQKNSKKSLLMSITFYEKGQVVSFQREQIR